MELILGNVVGFAIGIALAVLYMTITTRLARMERRIDLLLSKAGIDLAKVAADEAALLAKAGNKLEAIKLYREYTGCSLAEAKTQVERLAV